MLATLTFVWEWQAMQLALTTSLVTLLGPRGRSAPTAFRSTA